MAESWILISFRDCVNQVSDYNIESLNGESMKTTFKNLWSERKRGGIEKHQMNACSVLTILRYKGYFPSVLERCKISRVAQEYKDLISLQHRRIPEV